MNIFLLLLVFGLLSLPILTLLALEQWPTIVEIKWITMFLWVLLKEKCYQSSIKWYNTIKRVLTMNHQFETPSQLEWQKMSKVDRYRHFARRKFQKLENMYYSHVDELVQKLDDIGEIDPRFIPDFALYNFSFVRDWQYGEVSTEYAYGLLKDLKLSDVAEKIVCRRLRNFMHNKEKAAPQSCEYIKAVHDQLQVKCVPICVEYLNMLVKFFEQMCIIDKHQARLTWIEQIFTNDGEIKTQVREITLNQMFREIDCSIMQNNSHKYTLGQNILVFDEDLADEATACHWIFGPQLYIKQLQTQFKVTEIIKVSEEADYLKKLIGAHLK